MKMLMSLLKDTYKGRPAAVLGGGPSLPADMEQLPKDCILIAVNYHALKICEPDFMVYNDFPASDPLLLEAVQNFKGVKVSSKDHSDVKFDVPSWQGFYSSNTATWFGLWLGCDPVILCGMDCYQGEQKYFHEYEDKPHFHYPLEHHIRPWVEDAKNEMTDWKRVRVMSGPLVSVFEKYEAGSK